jgi:xylan 1,4-beta-xylosidase
MSYWVFSDIFEENGPRFTPFHGGFGLLNYQDLRKPAFFAYQFLNRLGPVELLGEDAASFATRDDAGAAQILLWDFTVTNPEQGENNQSFYKRDLPPRSKGTVTIELSGLAPGRYTERAYQVGYRVNDAYATYLDLGSPAQLTRAQVEQIRKATAGQPSLERLVLVEADGRYTRQLELRENDVWLILLRPG